MKRRDRLRSRMKQLAALVVGATTFTVVASPSSADVTAVAGSAFGYSADIGLFGGPPTARGPDPTVTLPPGGSAVPVTGNALTGSAQYGPATIFSSGPITVSTEGTTGSDGSVTSTTDVQTLNTSGQEVLTAASVVGTCTASEVATGGSTTITNGTLLTSEGDPDVDGDETVVPLPVNPAPNTTYDGTIESVGDAFRYVFNEQIVNADGSITVNAAHQYLLGPTAVGDLVIGQSVCGVTAVTVTTTTVDPGVTTTTVDPGVTTTTVDPGVTTTTAPGGGSQTTTTIRIGALVRTGSENDLFVAWAAMALTLGGLLLMGTKALPGPDDPPPQGPERG